MELSKYLDKEAFEYLEQYVLESRNQKAYSLWSMLYNPAMLPYKRNELALFMNLSLYNRTILVINTFDEIIKIFTSDYRKLVGISLRKNDILGCIAKVSHSAVSNCRAVMESGNVFLIERLSKGEIGSDKAFRILRDGEYVKPETKKIKETLEEIPKESGIGYEDFSQKLNSFISQINPYCYLHERYKTDFTETELINCQRVLQLLKQDLLMIETQIIKVKEIKT